MGNYYSTDFVIYGRSRETNKYVQLFELEQGNPMSRFKHETYAFSLNKKHGEQKALYLYCGWNRVAKCYKTFDQGVSILMIDFCGAEAALEWDNCKEQIPKVYLDVSWIEKQFGDHYVVMNDNNVYRRRYQNYRLSMKN